MELELELDTQLSGWQKALDCIPADTTISAQRFFAMLGAVDEDEALQAALTLEERGIGLDVSQLSVTAGGKVAQRLKLELELAREGRLPGGLTADDPLRLYWQELEKMPPMGEEQVNACLGCGDSGNKLVEGLVYLVAE